MSRKTLYVPIVASLFILLAGCTSGSAGRTGVYDTPSGWGNYKCTAVDSSNQGRVATGWATSERQARSNALEKCQAHGGSCSIAHCVNAM